MVPAFKEFAILGEMSENYFEDYSCQMLNPRVCSPMFIVSVYSIRSLPNYFELHLNNSLRKNAVSLLGK